MSSTVADLEIATYGIGQVVEGTQTGRHADTLVVSASQLAVGAGEPALAEATVEVVRPGEPVRITNVLDAVLPSVKADDSSATFPGVLGSANDRLDQQRDDRAAGFGRTLRLRDIAVLSVCDWFAAGYVGPDEFPDSFVDMAGPGAQRSPFGSTLNVVVRFVPAIGAPVAEVDLAIRRETLRVARDLAGAAIGQQPDEITRYPWPLDDAGSMPSIVLIVQVASEGPLTDTFFCGRAMTDLEPTAFDPRELFDGVLTNGAYDWPAVRNVTAAYQDSALLRELYSAHRERLNFAGFILAPGYLDTAEQKLRSAVASARLAKELGADGVICTTFSSGNSHTDTMLTVQACERAGLATTALVCETNGGLTDHVAEADCLISTGNEDDVVEPWTPERTVGGGRERAGEPVPTWAYLGACSQMGESRWTAVLA